MDQDRKVNDTRMSKMEIDRYGNKTWKNERGHFHRDDGPAIEYADGTKYWYRDGKLHREDGPAIESARKSKYWCHEGLLHRSDGPAIEYGDGRKEYWYGDKCYYKIKNDQAWDQIVRLMVFG